MAETKKVFKLFAYWQDTKEEEWLNQMAKDGWLLKDYRFFYFFEKSEPGNYVYKTDYKTLKNTDFQEYKAIFKDAGWEHAAQFAGWHYFRTKTDNGVLPDIYSDSDSRIQKYTSVLRTISLAYFALVAIFLLFLLNPESDVSDFTKGIFTGILGASAVVIWSVLLKVKKLKAEANKLDL